MADSRDRQLTEHFKLSEFRCKNGRDVPPELLGNVQRLANNLQVLREYLGKPIIIASGYRDPEYNRRVGGAKNSTHMEGEAGDLIVIGMSPAQVHAAILKLIAEGKMHNGGLGLYEGEGDDGFVHYDVRDKPARWYRRRK